MKLNEEKYLPYHLTENPCVIYTLNVSVAGIFKIEKKLPGHIKTVSGIFVSTTARFNVSKVIGLISLSFNGDGLRVKQFAVTRTTELVDTWRPMKMHETVLQNSLLQGYYQDLSQSSEYPYTVKIYIHYKND